MVFDPSGKHLKDIILSAYNPACTTWGGKNFDIIFCATATDKRPEPNPADDGGHMFRYKPEKARGAPKYEFAG
jgi:sugar lactone lactonase YvrE